MRNTVADVLRDICIPVILLAQFLPECFSYFRSVENGTDSHRSRLPAGRDRSRQIEIAIEGGSTLASLDLRHLGLGKHVTAVDSVIIEARPDHHHEVGLCADLTRDLVCVAAGNSDRERVVVEYAASGRTGTRACGIYAALARVRLALFAVRKFPRESGHDFWG